MKEKIPKSKIDVEKIIRKRTKPGRHKEKKINAYQTIYSATYKEGPKYDNICNGFTEAMQEILRSLGTNDYKKLKEYFIQHPNKYKKFLSDPRITNYVQRKTGFTDFVLDVAKDGYQLIKYYYDPEDKLAQMEKCLMEDIPTALNIPTKSNIFNLGLDDHLMHNENDWAESKSCGYTHYTYFVRNFNYYSHDTTSAAKNVQTRIMNFLNKQRNIRSTNHKPFKEGERITFTTTLGIVPHKQSKYGHEIATTIHFVFQNGEFVVDKILDHNANRANDKQSFEHYILPLLMQFKKTTAFEKSFKQAGPIKTKGMYQVKNFYKLKNHVIRTMNKGDQNNDYCLPIAGQFALSIANELCKKPCELLNNTNPLKIKSNFQKHLLDMLNPTNIINGKHHGTRHTITEHMTYNLNYRSSGKNEVPPFRHPNKFKGGETRVR